MSKRADRLRFDGMAQAEHIVKRLPSAEKHGEWIHRYYDSVEMKVCSECDYECSFDHETGISEFSYCPNCGAKWKARNRA